MSQQELIKKLESEGYMEIREIPGRGLCGLHKFLFTIGLCYGLDSTSYVGRYCYPYERVLDAIVAIKTWDGKEDPLGNWVKHKGRYEYSNPNLYQEDHERESNQETNQGRSNRA